MSHEINYKIVEYNGYKGYWVKLSEYLHISNIPRIIVLESTRQGKALPKTFYTKASEGETSNLMFFIIVDSIKYISLLYTPDELENYINYKFREEGVLLRRKEHNGKKGYWLKTKDLSELLNISISQVQKIFNSGIGYIEIVKDSESSRVISYFLSCEKQVYTKEDALYYLLNRKIEKFNAEKIDKKGLPSLETLNQVKVLHKKLSSLFDMEK